ncbi:MAG: catalase [Oscillospiraceae bacterium]|nr:catalase [Oscillospiraceae bacterium]MDY3218289.1 catalase [Candidatus Fimivivens sp.]
MQRSNNPSTFDHATMEQLMARYRAELLSYQRATPPGRPTLAQNLRSVTETRSLSPEPSNPKPAPEAESSALPKPSAAVIPDPIPAAMIEPAPAAVIEPAPAPEPAPAAVIEPASSSAMIAGFAASVAADLTAGIFAAAAAVSGPEIVAEAKAEETEELLLTGSAMEAAPPETPEMTKKTSEQMRSTLAESLANITDARALRPRCAGCGDPEDIANNAPSRYRSQLPEETEGLHHCPCEETPAEPGEGPLPLPTPALPAESCEETSAEPGEGPLPLPTPALPAEPCEVPPILSACSPEHRGLCCGHTEYEKCIGAYGTFRPYEKLGHLTKAAFLQNPGESVEVLARFAADLPDGGADASRCRRSFSVKFFCKKGEYDLLGQHLPVTVGCEQQAVLACCATTRADPATGLRSRSRFWEYVAENPVALNAAVWLYSDLGTIGSYRAIDGFCSPAVWTNSRGETRLARCCWLSRQRPQTLTRFESEELCGYDPDAVARDFVTAVTRGELPQYELAVQLLEPNRSLPFDPYDPTLIWPQEIAPPRRIGLMTLNRLPERIHPDLDAERFDASHLIDGIEAAPPALPAEGRELSQAGDHLRELSERERRRLIDNLCDELMQLPAELLEEILILFTKADLGFGQALTAALGG